MVMEIISQLFFLLLISVIFIKEFKEGNLKIKEFLGLNFWGFFQ